MTKHRPIIAALLAAAALGLSGCAGTYRAPFMPPAGETLNTTGFPVQLDYHNDSVGDLTGTARSHSILGLVAWGNSTPFVAARSAGIGFIQHIDAKFFDVLNIYSCYETTVTGTADQLRTATRQ